jgi:hypothetical protein
MHGAGRSRSSRSTRKGDSNPARAAIGVRELFEALAAANADGHADSVRVS